VEDSGFCINIGPGGNAILVTAASFHQEDPPTAGKWRIFEARVLKSARIS
jgi:hypothetical protein